MKEKQRNSWGEWLWNAWCCASIVGIWPRFIEPNLVFTTQNSVAFVNWPEDLDGLRIVQCSDLHISPRLSHRYYRKIQRKIAQCRPDIVVFTGDFLCGSKTIDNDLFLQWLQSIEAPYGCFAILGNHDYDQYLCTNAAGDYDVATKSPISLTAGFRRLLQQTILKKNNLARRVTEEAKRVQPHSQLLDILNQTHWQLLHNETVQIGRGKSVFNLVGLGEYMGGHCRPNEAFSSYREEYPGVILTHNPDSFPLLSDYPGDCVLAGHSHGNQVNLPFFRHRINTMEHPEWHRGWVDYAGKKFYINRGLGAVVPFRWFSVPEILQLTFRKKR